MAVKETFTKAEILDWLEGCSTLDDTSKLFLQISQWLEGEAHRTVVRDLRLAFNQKMMSFSSQLDPKDLELVKGELVVQTGSWRSVAPEGEETTDEDYSQILVIPLGWEALGWDRIPGTINEADLEIIELPSEWAGFGWEKYAGIVVSQ